jgi:hypothetical protein
MAFKYKLVKEAEVGSSKDIRHFAVSNPQTLKQMGSAVDKGAVKDFLQEPANSTRSMRLETDIMDSLENAGFDQFEIEEFMEFLYIARNKFVGGGKYGDKPLNEEKPKDPIQAFLDKKVSQWNSENPDYDPNAKNTFKDEVKEAVLKHLKENKPCWSGYKQIGMKKKGGKSVPNCVPNK